MLRTALFIIFLLATLPRGAAGSSISCPGGIVSSGDSAVDLIMKCGQPAYKDSHQEEITDTSNPNLRQRTYITIEQWTYDFGPQQFLRIVYIKNGVVAGVKTGNYGTSKDREPAGPECGGRTISTGETKSDILTKCGEPFYRTSHDEELRVPTGGTGYRDVIVTVEEWTYNFGPQRFMRIITFRNGKVIDVRTGNTYGR